MGGGSGLIYGYFNGKQGYVPAHCLKFFDSSLLFRSEDEEIPIQSYKPIAEVIQVNFLIASVNHPTRFVDSFGTFGYNAKRRH